MKHSGCRRTPDKVFRLNLLPFFVCVISSVVSLLILTVMFVGTWHITVPAFRINTAGTGCIWIFVIARRLMAVTDTYMPVHPILNDTP